MISKNVKEVLVAQNRADTLDQVQAALKDNTKVLSESVISSLLHYATKTHYASDETMPQRVAQHQYQMEKLQSRLNAHASSIDILKKQLSDLRTYLNVGTPEELSAAVGAGKRVAQTDLDKIKQQAIERAKEFAKGN